MSNPYQGIMFPVKGTVVEACGPACSVNHPVGTSWLLRGLPAGICSWAFNSIFPAYWTLRFGGVDPNEPNPDQMHVVCGRMGCHARFRIERISEAEAEAKRAAANLITLEDLEKSIPVGLSRRVR